jgi:hypothetical protein
MRTVHETEALRPSDPVPKHHSSNPVNNRQRLKLVLNSGDKKLSQEKGSTPGSPSSHSHPPNSATVPPAPASDGDYAHNNVIYLQDLASLNAPTMVQFPPDIDFTHEELRLPAPELFKLLRRQLLWATQDGEQLRAEAEVLEKQRKEEWEAKELLVENYMEAQVAAELRRRAEQGLPDFEALQQIQEDVVPARKLRISSKDGKQPWWRDPNAQLRTQQIKEQGPARKSHPADIRHEDSQHKVAVA